MPGVYISYPFCSQKCTYCNFASGVFPKGLDAQYIDALRAEIARHHWRWTPDTVYLGGGTPSQMEPARLDEILTAIPWRPWLEATLECAPGGITAENASAWRKSGINRVSLGVQSFIDAELKRTGRRHNAEIVEREVALLRSASIDRINIDLIAGLPGQTHESWLRSLEWVEKLAPEHVSVYMLEVDEDSRLGNEIIQGGSRYGATDVPTDDLIAEFYEIATERLEASGVMRYEISNFARLGCESVHNLKYWRLEPYVGFGSDAHSYDGALRWQNVDSPAIYVKRLADEQTPVESTTKTNPLSERFFVGLRLSEGIRPEPADWERFEDPINRFLSEGLLERDDEILRLTPRGVLLSNEVFAEFVL